MQLFRQKTAFGIRVRCAILLLFFCVSSDFHAANAAGENHALRIGVLKFGSANWQLQTIKMHGLDRAQGLNIEIVPFASKNATSVALQAGAVDIIVTDWIWALRQRGAGKNFRFVPYTTMFGALVTPSDSDITSVSDLSGKRIGVAGGPLDKSWLLLRALSKKTLGFDISKKATPVFAAPALLIEQMRRGRLDGVLAFWPDVARLQAEGYKASLPVTDILASLGIAKPIALIGYVFHAPDTDFNDIDAFLRAVSNANEMLNTQGDNWDALRPLMRVQSDAAFTRLQRKFQDGVPGSHDVNIESAAKLFDILVTTGGNELVGKDTAFDSPLFYVPVLAASTGEVSRR